MRHVGSLALLAAFACAANAQVNAQSTTPEAQGQQTFRTRCASCHGTTGNGGEFAPGIVTRVPLRSDEELTHLLHDGLPASGMPAFADLEGADRENLIRYLRTLHPSEGPAAAPVTVRLTSGEALTGTALSRSATDLDLFDAQQKLHLLRSTPNGSYRKVTSETSWTSYNGSGGGDRYSKLSEITPANVHKLEMRWLFNLSGTRSLQTTPVVADGVMYVTSANECYALDAGSGRQIWHWQRQRTQGLTGGGGGGANRGAAIAGDRVFMSTDNAHLIALDRSTGKLLWETTMADWHLNYNGTGAPLPVGDMVVAGIAGGDNGARGFIAAYAQDTGKELWRTWTVPARGEPGSETWQGTDIDHPSGATWMTGSYDKELDTIFWPVGNPGPDLIGDQRGGDNLYTESILALEPKTGKMKWYFQFTPHDVHDFDAMAPSALIDTIWQGSQKKLLVQANRNGFLYVLDRTNGRFLFGTAYTPKLTWATGLDANGHPIPAPGQEPTHEGNLICPWLNGASNWYSSSWNPGTGLYYVQTNDKCGIYTRTEMTFQPGRGYMGGSFAGDPKDPGVRKLRAFDLHTGKAVWELPQTGAGDTWGGVLSTAGGVVFFGADDGTFAAADAKTGKQLWSFRANVAPHSSPMTYQFDGHQYVVTTAGSNIVAFALPETTR